MAELLGASHNKGGLVICGAVYAELLAHPKATPRFVDNFLQQTSVTVDFDTDEHIWRDAARAYARYAQSKRLLVDFVVGAHAMHRADRLLTLDASRYTQDFPKLALVPA